MLNLLYQTGYPYLHMLHYKPNILRLTLLPVTDLPASKTSTKTTFMSLPSLCYSLKITNYGIREKTTFCIYVMRCAILSHLYNLKSVKNTPSWVFFTFFTLYKCYQIAQRTIYSCFGMSCYIIIIIIIINDLFQFWLMINST